MSGLMERLRSSAEAFRKHNVYTQDGDPVRLTVQAGEAEEAAAAIERLRGYAVHDDGCRVNNSTGDKSCTCGLTALLAELGEG